MFTKEGEDIVAVNAAYTADTFAIAVGLSKVEADNNGTGFNIKTSSFVNMIREGIIDPTKVTRTALENAVSVAGTMLITECTIVDKPLENENKVDSMATMGM